MEVLLTDYYMNLRAALADPGVAGTYAWADEQLRGGLLTTIQTGCGPRCMTLTANNTKTLVDGETENYDARGYLVFQTALILLGGQVPFSFKQRSQSVQFRPEERSLTLDHLRRMIRQLEGNGDPHGSGSASFFGIWADMENALTRTTEGVKIA